MAVQRAWQGYTDDTGITFNAYVGLTNSIYFSAFNAARAAKPKALQMRYITLVAPSTGQSRRVPVGGVAAGVWTGATTTLTLIMEDGSSLLFNVTGRVGEKWRRLPHA